MLMLMVKIDAVKRVKDRRLQKVVKSIYLYIFKKRKALFVVATESLTISVTCVHAYTVYLLLDGGVPAPCTLEKYNKQMYLSMHKDNNFLQGFHMEGKHYFGATMKLNTCTL